MHLFVSAPGDNELSFYLFDPASSTQAEELMRTLAPPQITRASADSLKRWLWIELAAIEKLPRAEVVQRCRGDFSRLFPDLDEADLGRWLLVPPEKIPEIGPVVVHAAYSFAYKSRIY